MKKYLFLTIVCIILAVIPTIANSNKHTGYASLNLKSNFLQTRDTLKYLQDNIITHKTKYQHQELNLILNELNLTVKSYSVNFEWKIRGDLKCITLFFDDTKTTTTKLSSKQGASFLVIYFEQTVSNDTVGDMYGKNLGKWTETEKNFYGKLIVKDIQGPQVKKK